ncbi:MAG: hypothetical protein ACOYMG_03620, partial [Candidatus Methylumidiphilus sp.]
SGKTTIALGFAGKSAQTLNSQIIIAQPTTDLIEQSVNYLAEHFPDTQALRFDSTSHPGEVYESIIAHMTNWDNKRDGGCVVFITHTALWELPFIPYKANWDLIIDEIPNVDFEFHYNLPETYAWTTKCCLDIQEVGENLVVRLQPKPEALAQVKQWARNKYNDDVISVLQPLYKELVSPHSEVFVTRASWNRLDQKGHGQLIAHGFKKPTICEGWKSVRIMGAHFTKSLLYYVWQSRGVTFERDTAIKVDGDSHDKDLGKRLVISYFSAKPWSKNLRDRIATDDDILGNIRPVIKEVMKGEPFLWVANNDIEESFLKKDFGLALRIPNIPHGRNDFRSYTKIAFLSALNNTPSHFSNMDKVWGVSPEHLREGRYFQVAYQAIMRTALRQADSTEQVTALVPDADLAKWLLTVFPGAKLRPIDPPQEAMALLGDARKARGRPTKQGVLTTAQRTERSRDKAKQMLVTKNTIKDALFVTPIISLSHEASIYSQSIIQSNHTDWEELRGQLRELHGQYQPKKEDGTLISGATFDAGRSADTSKGLQNIVGIHGVWLDIDNGELKPDEFRRMFPEVRWLIWNSFNNGKDNKRKYRVLFPTTSPMTPEIYHTIWDTIAERIKSFGYYVGSVSSYEKEKSTGRPLPPFSGLDVSKRTANSFFYVPCRAGLGKNHTFWMENWGDETPVLNPDDWALRIQPVKQEYRAVAVRDGGKTDDLMRLIGAIKASDTKQDSNEERTAHKVVEARRMWRNAFEHTGHDEFWNLALRLKRAGLEHGDIEDILNQEAQYGRSPKDRRAEIKSIMKRL